MKKIFINDFEDLNLHSNKNMEKVVAGIVNESSNAALVNMFDDSLILLDHEEDKFYFAKYNFDPNSLVLTIEDYDPIELFKEDDDLNSKALNYFEEESEVTISELFESFKDAYLSQDRFIHDITQETLINKDVSDIIDYSEMSTIDESVKLSIQREPFYKEYKQRLETHPIQEVKMFDWKTSVKVSLVETEDVGRITTSVVKNAENLWKEELFRDKFVEHCTTMIEDVDGAISDFIDLFQKYPQIYLMESDERQAVFGKAMVYTEEIRKDSEELLKGFSKAFNEGPLAEAKEEYILEAGDNMDNMTAGGEGGEMKDKPTDVSKKSQSKAAKSLKSIAVEIEDPKLKKKLESIISSLEESAGEGTDPRLMKEIVSILEV